MTQQTHSTPDPDQPPPPTVPDDVPAPEHAPVREPDAPAAPPVKAA